MLKEKDPDSAAAIHPNNVKRVTRALEYLYETGSMISEHNAREREKTSPYLLGYYVITDDRQILYDRINRRVDKMISAGLEKEVIVINLPVDSVYTGSDDISKIFEELKIDDLITSQVKEDKDNEDILAAGDYKDLDLKALVKSKCDLVLLPEESIEAEDVKDAKAQKEAKEHFEGVAEDLANLDISVLVDRAEYEETDEAKAEWLKVYGILFGCEKEANELFKTMTK